MELLKALQSSNEQRRNRALNLLYLDPKINGRIDELARYHGLKQEEPDDILQKGIIILNKNILSGKFRGESKVSTYLISICRYLILDSVKKVNKVDLQGIISDNSPIAANFSEDSFAIKENTTEENRRDKVLHSFVEQMTPECKYFLKNYYLKNKSMRQVAEEHDSKNYEQTKKAMHSCRDKLRKAILKNPILSQILKKY